jgi:hypothetical protein
MTSVVVLSHTTTTTTMILVAILQLHPYRQAKRTRKLVIASEALVLVCYHLMQMMSNVREAFHCPSLKNGALESKQSNDEVRDSGRLGPVSTGFEAKIRMSENGDLALFDIHCQPHCDFGEAAKPFQLVSSRRVP